MRYPGLRASTILLLLFACGGSEKRVVDQYFNAVRAKDNQTISSFAAVSFDKPVESWKIISATAETKAPATLPDLAKKLQDLEKQIADNKKDAQRWNNDHFGDLDQVRDLRKKNAAIPARLQGVAADWDKFNEKDRDLKKQAAEAREAFEKEKRNVKLSVGDVERVETLPGEMLTQDVEVQVTAKGESAAYTMGLRKYELQREGPRLVSRWMVYTIQPK